MRQSNPSGRAAGKSSAPPRAPNATKPADALIFDGAARASLGLTPATKARPGYPPQFSKTTGSGQGINKIGRNWGKFPPNKSEGR